MGENDVKIWFTEKEAAEFTGYSVRTLQKWRYLKCKLRYYKRGRAVRYHIRDLKHHVRYRDIPVEVSL